MKKIFIAVMSAVMALFMLSCGGDTGVPDQKTMAAKPAPQTGEAIYKTT